MADGKTIKIVDFTLCKKCRYYLSSDYKEPCKSCLLKKTNTNSNHPINYKDKEK